MFGSRHVGVRDIVFDSHEEAVVANCLENLRHEQIITSYIPHPVIAGVVADFLVHLGGQSKAPGRLIILEYDGLGAARRDSLLGKVLRYSELGVFGFGQAWVSEPSTASVRAALDEPSPPHLVKKTLYCPLCGEEQVIYVIAAEELTEEVPCHGH